MFKARRLGFLAAIMVVLLSGTPSTAATNAWSGENEVFYQLFVRSFYDSSGDRNGDLRGIQNKLDYLRHLGITSVLLTPIVPSPFYHNYFPSAFEGVDTTYGSMRALGDLVRTAHARGMKIYLDEEFQYAVKSNPWFAKSIGHPSSKYGKYILYRDVDNTEPEAGAILQSYTGEKFEIALVNLHNPAVKDYFGRMFVSLTKLGVDGFRLDHMMDDLDNKGIEKNLFADFWAPVMARARAANAKVKFIAEQADWGYGGDYLTRGGVDMVFAFPIRNAIASFDPSKIEQTINETLRVTPPGKGQLTFIENHDMSRFASVVKEDARMERVGAALSVLLKGTPLIYYGQEIGMKGDKRDLYDSDANDIPVREAFKWNDDMESSGSAIWYKSDKPWWINRYNRSHDGVSAAAEENDPNSLLSFYRRLLAIRRARPELQTGDERFLPTDQKALAILRSTANRASLLIVNLSDQPEVVVVSGSDLPGVFGQAVLKDLVSGTAIKMPSSALRVTLAAFQVKLLTPN